MQHAEQDFASGDADYTAERTVPRYRRPLYREAMAEANLSPVGLRSNVTINYKNVIANGYLMLVSITMSTIALLVRALLSFMR